jgi:hypothetical protein
MSDPKTLSEFLATYDPDGTRVIADITPVRDDDGNSPFVIVRHGKFTAILALMPFSGDKAHLCIDVHAFVNDMEATGSVFGMDEGRRYTLPATGTTSHGWDSAGLIAVLIGEQAVSQPPARKE